MASFGEELKRERELRDISLREISEATKISVRFLEALEQDRFDVLPGGIFNRGFIRAYARFIGIDGEEMVNAYLHEVAQQQERHRQPGSAAAPRAGAVYRPKSPPPRASSGSKTQRPKDPSKQAPASITKIAERLRGRSAWLLWGLALVAFVVGAIVIALSLVRGDGEASPASDALQAPPQVAISPLVSDRQAQGEEGRLEPSSLDEPVPVGAPPVAGADQATEQQAPTPQTEPPVRPPTEDRSPANPDGEETTSTPQPTSAGSDTPHDQPAVTVPRSAPDRSEPRVGEPEVAVSNRSNPPTEENAQPDAAHALRIRAAEITRVKVECGGRVALFQELWPGQEISLRCAEPIVLSADNGGAVTYGLDGGDVAALGQPGQRVSGSVVAPDPGGR